MTPNSGSVDPSRFPNEAFDLYSIPAFDNGRPELSLGREIGSSKQVVQSNDVLLSKIVPHIRRAWVVGEQRGCRQIASGEWIVFRSAKIHPSYLRYLLVEDRFHAQFMNTVAGVGGSLLRARPAQVADIEISLPSLSEQRQIAGRLEQADRLRRTRRYALELTDTFLPAAFLELFGDPVRNERLWPTEILASVATKITDGEHLNPKFVPIGFPIVMAEQVNDWGVSLDSCKCVSADDFNKFIRKCEPVKCDILIVSRGATIGRTCVVNTKNPFCLMGSVILIKPDSSVVNPYFLSALLKSASFLRVLRTTSGASAQQAIYIAHLKEKALIVPPLPLQEKFAALVQRVEYLRAVQREALRQAEHLFASLLHCAFSG
jgi:type I restriction enzyme, S subunit